MAAIPAEMAVIEISAPGGPEVLKPARRPVPRPVAGEVLIRVEAAGVNGPDLMQRKGLYPPPAGAPDLLGLEVSGEVVAVGDQVDRFRGRELGSAPAAARHGAAPTVAGNDRQQRQREQRLELDVCLVDLRAQPTVGSSILARASTSAERWDSPMSRSSTPRREWAVASSASISTARSRCSRAASRSRLGCL